MVGLVAPVWGTVVGVTARWVVVVAGTVAVVVVTGLAALAA